MKIEHFKIENFKRLRYVEMRPEGNLIVIGGRNGQGKTSLIDALADALAGRKTAIPEPVTRGEERSEVIVDTDDGWRIRKYYTAEGTYGLAITKGDLEAAKGVTLLSKWSNALSFDPLAFARDTPHAQAEQLRKLVGLDFFDLDKRRAEIYEKRTVTNRLLRDAIGVIESMPEPPADAPQVMDVRELLTQQADASLKIEGNALLRRALEKAQDARLGTRDRVNDLAVRVDRLKRELAAAERDLQLAEEADDGALQHIRELTPRVDVLVDPDIAAINAKIAVAEEHNERARTWQERERAIERKMELEKESEGFTFDINDIDEQKEAAVREADFPVAGLGFNADGLVTFGGLPFSQSAESERIRVSAAIALAMNPEMRVLLIRDGSGLDEDSLGLLEDLAVEHGAQIFIERIGEEGASIVIENGMAK